MAGCIEIGSCWVHLHCRSYVVDGSGQMQMSELNVDELLRPASLDDTSRSAGVSTGTRYALGKTIIPNKAIDVHLFTIS